MIQPVVIDDSPRTLPGRPYVEFFVIRRRVIFLQKVDHCDECRLRTTTNGTIVMSQSELRDAVRDLSHSIGLSIKVVMLTATKILKSENGKALDSVIFEMWGIDFTVTFSASLVPS